MYTDIASSWDIFRPARTQPFSASLEQCVQMVPQWMAQCMKYHADCSQSRPPFTPTRLLHVGSLDTDPVLVEGLSGSQRYIALSYCWGTKVTLTTTRATLPQHKRGLEWTTIPATFQDVILLARGLGINYVWIDAICIIQGDLDDWNHEAASMASVYTNAYLTVAPIFSTDAEAGIFRNVASVHAAFKLKDTDTVARSDDIYAREHLPTWKGFNNSPLQRRGWTFQEYLLSPRILCIQQSEVVWECASAEWCCCQLDHDVSSRHEMRAEILNLVRRRYEQPEVARQLVLTKETHSIARKLWSEIISSYSKKRLTKQTDRLVALAGIAEIVGQMTGSRYLAGLWEHDLMHSLLWECLSIEAEVWTPSQDYIAPSWSWASMECATTLLPLRSPALQSDLDCDLLEASCTLAGTGAFCAVSDGVVRLRCPVMAAIYKSEDTGRSSMLMFVQVVTVLEGCEVPSPDVPPPCQYFLSDKNRSSLYYKPLLDGDPVLCLLIRMKPSAINKYDFQPQILIVRNTSRLVNDEVAYERVGICAFVNANTVSWFAGTHPQALYIV